MLQSYHYRMPIEPQRFGAAAQAVRGLASRLVRIEPKLRGLKVEQDNGFVNITLRVAGNTRWDISRDAKKLIIKLTRAARIPTATVKLEQVITEINGRQLYLGEGRTEMTRRPRSERMADGNPWDHYEWWGDELSGESDLPL